ncbi:MAG TPA: 50S ribosomal protein L10 [Erysipelotrichaceae bacterium]|nr:50S ribosomal protein L10 [Erysipelotrichaceae bacterium]
MNQSILDQKVAVVNEISEKFSGNQSSVVVEYRGLSVGQVTELRRKLRDEGVELKVYKNSMAQRAAAQSGYEELVAELVGPNAIAFSQDAVAPSRILSTFAIKNKALVLKGGIVEGKVVNADMIKELAKLPNKDGMISMLLGMFQSPVRNFAYAVKQIADQREEN